MLADRLPAHKSGAGWGGVGWDNNVHATLLLSSLARCHIRHATLLVSSLALPPTSCYAAWGGVGWGWGGDVTVRCYTLEDVATSGFIRDPWMPIGP